ncbi:formate hydrogenlyase [Anoxybacterium hadale]|uniref:Formate hydrogenlyase n=1 Tax=Anoxybacterium hadale TaxID=3408580 RepID=A0ACD1A7G8_9FIRM|nr:formate hydrogenlyase [Clostridiales bacterium]
MSDFTPDLISSLISNIIQFILLLLLAPLTGGIIKKVKALSQKRKGAPVLQMYFDLWKLIRKESVVSDTASWIFKATPYIVFATSATAALLVPVTTLLPSAVSGDILMLIYLLALGRFFMCLSALDTGSTFGGMGASRESMISALIEPSMLVSVFTVGLISGSTAIDEMMTAMRAIGNPLLHPVYILCFFAMIIIILAETSRIPVDDPSTHLELTMVHEAMLLEYSGRHLALMEYGAAIKQLIFLTLLVNLFLPTDQLAALIGISGASGAVGAFGIAGGSVSIVAETAAGAVSAAAVIAAMALYILKIILASLVIAVTEISTVKFRFFSIPNLAALSFILAFLGFLQYFVLGR